MRVLRYHKLFGRNEVARAWPCLLGMDWFFALDLSTGQFITVPVGGIGTRTLRTITLMEDAGFITLHWLMTESALTRLISVVMEVDEELGPYIERLFEGYGFSSGLLHPPTELQGLRAAGWQDLVRPGMEQWFIGSIHPPADIQPSSGTCLGVGLRSRA
jgi:hypothetical protein